MYLSLQERKQIQQYQWYEPNRVSKVKFQELLQRQGPGYWYQLRFFILFGIQWLIGAQMLLGLRFIFQDQSFDCHDVDGLTKDSCKQFVCSLSRIEQMNYIHSGGERITATSEFMFFCEDQYKINVIISACAFTCLLGFILFPHLSNIKGPKFTIIIGLIISSLGCIVVFLAESFDILIVGCCLQFFSLRPIMTLHITYINDNTQGKFRQFSTIGLQLFFGVGQFIQILIQYLTLNWRWVILYFQFIPLVLATAASIFNLFESPIYMHKKSTIQAIDILNKIAKINNNEQIKINILQSRLLDQNQKPPNFLDLLGSSRQRTKIFTTSFIFFAIQVAYGQASYYMNKEKLNIYQNNVITTSSELLAIFVSNIFILSIKRKQIIFFGLIIAAIVSMSFIFIPIPSQCKHEICSIKIVQIVLLNILSFCFSICWCIFYVYVPELFSININSLVLGFSGMFGVIGQFLAPYLVALLEGNHNMMFLLGMLLQIASILLIFVEETHGKQIIFDKLDEKNDLNNQEEEIIALEL